MKFGESLLQLITSHSLWIPSLDSDGIVLQLLQQMQRRAARSFRRRRHGNWKESNIKPKLLDAPRTTQYLRPSDQHPYNANILYFPFQNPSRNVVPQFYLASAKLSLVIPPFPLSRQLSLPQQPDLLPQPNGSHRCTSLRHMLEDRSPDGGVDAQSRVTYYGRLLRLQDHPVYLDVRHCQALAKCLISFLIENLVEIMKTLYLRLSCPLKDNEWSPAHATGCFVCGT